VSRVFPTLLALIALLAAWSAPARAQGNDDADPALEQARQLFQEAEQQYRLGKFAAALELYSKAYEAKSFPAFLFNIGQCHRELKEHERAIFFYRSYLRDEPAAANREVVEQLIADCEVALAAQQAAARQAEAERKAEAERQRQAEAEQRRAEQERLRLEQERLATERLKAAAAAAEAERRRQEEAEPPVWETWWFWTAIGGGAVAVAGAITAGVLLSDPGTREVMPSGSLGTLDRRGE